MDLTTLARQLTETIGAEHVSSTPDTCAAYALAGQTPDIVAAPGSVAELGQVMALASAHRAIVTPWGGGTRQAHGGMLARDAGRPWLVVRTRRLNRLVEYEPADLTIVVEAGMTPIELDALLRPHGQMLPVDAPLPERTTLGGMIATAADGPRRLGYGLLRDLLLGTSVVETSGRISKAGGAVVKNVSGYDMMKLYLGSYGTLAIVATASFKLIPRPRDAATIWCSFATQAAAFALVEALHTSQLAPAAVEYLAGAEDLPAPRGLAVLAEGLQAAVERHVRDVSHLAHQAGAQDVQILRDEDSTRLWARIANLPQTADPAPNELVVRLSCLPSDLNQALQDAASLADRHGLALLVDARALSGVAYLRLHSAATANQAGTALRAWHQEMLVRWPYLAVLACAVVTEEGRPLKEHLSPWGPEPAGYTLMQRIKHEFDPQGMLNPGRFVV